MGHLPDPADHVDDRQHSCRQLPCVSIRPARGFELGLWTITTALREPLTAGQGVAVFRFPMS